MCSASWSPGGRWYSTARCESSYHGPTSRASRITSHPVRVCHVVSRTSVPGTYRRPAGTGDVRRADAEMARRTVEHGREDRRAVGSGQAEPLDAAARPQQRLDLPVRQERVLRDRGERASLREPHRALGDGHRADSSGTAKDRSSTGSRRSGRVRHTVETLLDDLAAGRARRVEDRDPHRRQPRPPSRPPHPRARARSPAPRRPSRPGGTRSPREPAPERRRGRPRCAWAG